MTCLLCGSADGSVIERLLADDVVDSWQRRMQIDIKGELPVGSSLSRIACQACGLEYYDPAAAGSERLYRDLQKQPWYYVPEKWEYRTALHDIVPRSRLLEVGCGDGAFVALAHAQRHADARGIELNAKAVAEARRLGRPVVLGDVETAAAQEPASYDSVCHFQVLEHIAQPRAFLEACIRLLRPGGRLCIGIPNNDAYLGALPDALLSQPPHHVSRWGEETLRRFPELFPLRLERIAFEPLDQRHVDEYLASRAAQWSGHSRMVRGIGRRVTSVMLRIPVLRRQVRGHTLYAAFTRLAS